MKAEFRSGWSPEAAAQWLAEAVETGNALATLPDDIAPRDASEGQAVAFAVLERLEIPPCGVRLLFRVGLEPLLGPMIEGRMVPSGTPIALQALRHPVLTAAVIGVLAEPLHPGVSSAPAFATLHPAVDIEATRYANPDEDAAASTADLARLGLIVGGRGRPLAPHPILASLGEKGGRRVSAECDLAVAFAKAAQAARDLGGLPAGALLVVAGLSPPAAPAGIVSASLGKLGRVQARLV
ncbi:MAG TPA: hypothetical protein VGN83_26900 [Falsiroseomonas sp.]|nr:hypothetical protein [Falsiroseomonas sp.]